MQMLKELLNMSPLAREAFQAAERASMRHSERLNAKVHGADERIAAAEAKRQRRRERNLLPCS